MTETDPPGTGAPARGPTQNALDTPAVDRSGVDWEAVRHDFVYSGLSQRRIAWHHGISEGMVSKKKRAGGWARVVPLSPLSTRRPVRRTGEPPTPTETRRARLIKRLYAVLDGKVTELERRIAERQDGPESAADAERDTRTMTALMQIYTKLAALDQARAANKNAGTNGARTDDDADRFRRDLAGRLARLSDGGDA
jgi:hypothetical protein